MYDGDDLGFQIVALAHVHRVALDVDVLDAVLVKGRVAGGNIARRALEGHLVPVHAAVVRHDRILIHQRFALMSDAQTPILGARAVAHVHGRAVDVDIRRFGYGSARGQRENQRQSKQNRKQFLHTDHPSFSIDGEIVTLLKNIVKTEGGFLR